jgi:hypothetical protein
MSQPEAERRRTRAQRYRLVAEIEAMGRIVALALMLGGLVLLGYVAGVLAAILFGRRDGAGRSPPRQGSGASSPSSAAAQPDQR